MLPAPLWLALVRAMLVVEDGTRITPLSLHGEGKEEAASPQKKKANPASLRSAAPSKGRGSRGYSLLPLEGGAPKGRRLDGDGGVKESEGDLLKYAINESTLSTADAVPLPPMGKAAIRGYRFSRIVKANTRICRKRITTDKAFPAWGRWRAERAG